MKRIIKILVALILIVVIAFALYLIFSNKKDGGRTDIDTTESVVPFDNQQDIVADNTIPPIVNEETATTNPFTRVSSKEVLRQITDFPVSGYVSFIEKVGTEDIVLDPETNKEVVVQRSAPVEIVRYMKKETGEIFDAEITETIITQRKRTVNIIPKNADALFLGTNAVMTRFLNHNGRTIESIFGDFPPEVIFPESRQVLNSEESRPISFA